MMKGVLGSIQRILDGRRAYAALLLLNLLVTLAVMWGARNQVLTDTWSYLGLAEGILHGNYSMWWRIGDAWPDTFRSPGYPLLVALVIKVFGTWKAMYALNFLLYAASLLLMLRIVARIDDRLIVRNVFLLMLLPLVNVPFYIMQLYTEIPVLAAITLTLHLVMRPGRWGLGTALAIGVLFGIIQQCKPVFLLFPFFFAAAAWVMDRRRMDWRGHGIALVVFMLIQLPFGFWNLRHHGVFRITPIEGGPGYMQLGYWAGKTPGYVDTFHLHNFMGDELVRFVPEKEVPRYVAQYQEEWRGILARLEPLRNKDDSIMLASRAQLPYPAESTWNTRYTLERERMLASITFKNMRDDPWYTLRYKAYTAVRLWVIGIQRADFAKAGLMGKARMLFASLSTGLIFTLFMILVPLAFRKGLLSLRELWPMLLYLAYFGLMHIPFTIQARYTTPVRFIMLAVLAIAAVRLMQRRRGVMAAST